MPPQKKKWFKSVVLLFVLVFSLTACDAIDSSQDEARRAEQSVSADIARDMQRAHPVPKFRTSQIRQNLVELYTAQAETTQTTTFFFNMGVQDPVHVCPSIGFPIPTTAQLTNPDQVDTHHGNPYTTSQMEPTGIYTGDSTGTYAICVDAQGEPYAKYWEGFIDTVTGPAEWKDGRIKLVGPPSFDFSAEADSSEDSLPE